MSRYIDAEILLDAMRHITLGETDVERSEMKIVHYICHMPHIDDVRENVRSEWLDYWDNPIKFYSDGRYSAHCSVCGYHPEYEEEMRSANFCPNCGADMRGEKP